MSSNLKKTIATIVIASLSLIIYFLFLYYQGNNDKPVEMYTAILFALIPALIVNAIWYNKVKKAKEI